MSVRSEDKIVASMRRAVKRLARDAAELQRLRGRKLCLFAEGGSLYVIDSDRDSELCEIGTPPRAVDYDEGGSIVARLDGNPYFDGGGW